MYIQFAIKIYIENNNLNVLQCSSSEIEEKHVFIFITKFILF